MSYRICKVIYFCQLPVARLCYQRGSFQLVLEARIQSRLNPVYNSLHCGLSQGENGDTLLQIISLGLSWRLWPDQRLCD